MGLAGGDGAKVYGDRFLLKLSRDKMAAMISSKDDLGLKAVDLVQLKKELRSNGVIYGIMDNPELKSPGTYVVAKGLPPVNGENAKVRMHVKPANVRSPKLKDPERDQVDYRELGTIVNVTEGRLLMEKIPPTPGVPGRDVLGGEIPPKPGKDNKLKVGKGVRLSDDEMQVYSSLDGKFMLVDGRPGVFEEHTIRGDLDMSVGNISFGGKLLQIEGEVLPGFQVKCRGDVKISRGINNALAMVGGDLLVNGSVCGEDAVVKVRGDARLEFVENGPQLEVAGSLEVKEYMMQAVAHVGKDVNGRKNGRIIGGRLVAGGSVYIYEMGSDAEVNMEVSVGMNLDLLARKERLDEDAPLWSGRLNELIRDISGLQKIKKEQGAGFSSERAERLKKCQEVMPKLMERVDRLNEQVREVEDELATMVEEKIFVYGTLYPGVTVRIGPAVRLVSNIEESAVVFFDKSSQKILIRKMSQDEKATQSISS